LPRHGVVTPEEHPVAASSPAAAPSSVDMDLDKK
jgi:hypothetical protein